jgi:hypothetical protein
MAQLQPEKKHTVSEVLKLVEQLSLEEQDELCDSLTELQQLRKSLSVGLEQLERGEGIPAEEVFQQLRAQHAEIAKDRSKM